MLLHSETWPTIYLSLQYLYGVFLFYTLSLLFLKNNVLSLQVIHGTLSFCLLLYQWTTSLCVYASFICLTVSVSWTCSLVMSLVCLGLVKFTHKAVQALSETHQWDAQSDSSLPFLLHLPPLHSPFCSLVGFVEVLKPCSGGVESVVVTPEFLATLEVFMGA